jgi:hypothetical protein
MIKNDVGFVLPVINNENNSEALCKLISILIDKHRDKQFCIFNQHSYVSDTNNVPLLPMSHARYFTGDLFVMDFASLLICSNFPSTKNIYYFTNSAPWMSSYNAYSLWNDLFSKKNLNIVTNNPEMSDIYNIIWNIKTILIKELSYESLLSIL